MPDHPNFEYWKLNDTQPFPVGQITLFYGTAGGASASADIDLPAALPHAATVAERSIGITDSAKLWFGIECTVLPNGKVSCEAVLCGRHLHWFPDHPETAPGIEQELRVTDAQLKAGGGDKEAFAVHGPHFDLFHVSWWPGVGKNKGRIHFTLTVTHWEMTIHEFEEARKENARRSQREPRERLPDIPYPPPPKQTPEPKPRPQT
jgi:hypothetical protein